MKLIRLRIHNFKCIKALSLEPQGVNMNIYGANAAGKTTIADAYFWLLFGKDLKGAAEFDIFPHDAEDGAQPSVEGEFERLNGSIFTLRRSIKKSFVRKRGEATAEYKGNTREFYIDGVPKKAGEFDTFIASLGGESRIMMLTDPDRFPGKMKWQDRRKVLLEAFAGDMTEHDVIRRHRELAALEDHLGAMYTVQDVLDTVKAKRKKINNDLKAIPGRIDELVRMKPDVGADDSDRPQISKLAKERMEALSKIEGFKNGAEISNANALISNIKAQVAESKAKYTAQSLSGNDVLEKQGMQLRRDMVKAQDRIDSLRRDVTAYEKQISLMDIEIGELRGRFHTEKSLEFTDCECPTCHRPYPESRIEEYQASFNFDKAEKLKRISAQGKDLKASQGDLNATLDQKKTDLKTEEARLTKLQSQLKQIQAKIVTPMPFEETPTYKTLSEKLIAAEDRLLNVQNASKSQLAGYEKKVKDIDAQLEKAREIADDRKTAARIDERIKELSDEEKKLGINLAEADNLILLCERFTQLQADDFEMEINEHFQDVRCKLFDRQINGGIAPVCEATVGGSEYNNSLNTAAKVNAGLDIINAFSDDWGESWPVFIDNAESVTEYMGINAQVIKLFVSAKDKALRVEIEQQEKMALKAS